MALTNSISPAAENKDSWTRPIYTAPATVCGIVNKKARTESLYEPTASTSSEIWKMGL